MQARRENPCRQRSLSARKMLHTLKPAGAGVNGREMRGVVKHRGEENVSHPFT